MKIVLFIMALILLFVVFNKWERRAEYVEAEKAYYSCLQDLPRSECITILSDF